jgi:pimeloyl-ACP methyl ester carboxylesterase
MPGETNGTTQTWDELPNAMSKSVKGLQKALDNDAQWQAYINTKGITDKVTMAIASAGGGDAILVSVDKGSKTTVSTGPSSKADFTLGAKGEQWQKFFDADPKSPYTSFVGLQGMNIKQEGVGVTGDQTLFAQNCHLTTRLLELLRDGMHGPMQEESQPETDEDHIIGRYIYIDAPVWGRTKLFYESSGEGKQEIVFLHTAGSDSRQYHGVMNDSRMRQACKMIAFDLPAHGRSFPGSNHLPGNHTNNETAYVGTIAAVIKALKLTKPIVCGASMAGQVSVACAIRAEEVGCGGTIPLQGCDFLTMDRTFNDKSPTVNQALWNPDWIWGMMVSVSLSLTHSLTHSLTTLHNFPPVLLLPDPPRPQPKPRPPKPFVKLKLIFLPRPPNPPP